MRIQRGLGSRLLACGCLVGLYETYEGKNVCMIDVPAPQCADATHRPDAVVDPAAIIEAAQTQMSLQPK